jgi:ubiquinone/menaquinone biosynthesis C-methylase UbiE
MNSNQRDNWIKKQLLSLPKGYSILDIGCGEQPYRKYCDHLSYVGQDFCEYNGVGDGKGLQNEKWMVKADIVSESENIPVEDESFDVILCSEVLEHVHDPISTLEEIDRIIRPGGIVLITTPFTSMTHQSPFFYCTGFSENFYKFHLNRYNLTITRNGNYFEWLAKQINSLQLQYADADLSGDQIADLRKAIKTILSFSPHGKKSDELMNFGLFIKAIKWQK